MGGRPAEFVPAFSDPVILDERSMTVIGFASLPNAGGAPLAANGGATLLC